MAAWRKKACACTGFAPTVMLHQPSRLALSKVWMCDAEPAEDAPAEEEEMEGPWAGVVAQMGEARDALGAALVAADQADHAAAGVEGVPGGLGSLRGSMAAGPTKHDRRPAGACR